MSISRIDFGFVDGTLVVPVVPNRGLGRTGDIMVACGWNAGNTTPPALPTGWTNIESSGANNQSSRVAWRELGIVPISLSWPTASYVEWVIYRGVKPDAPARQNSTNTGSSATLNYPALGGALAASSWILTFGMHRTASDVEQAPTGTTLVVSSATNGELATHDSNGVAASWASANVSVNQNNGWKTHVIELEVATEPVDQRQSHENVEVWTQPTDAIRQSHENVEVFTQPGDVVRQSFEGVEVWTQPVAPLQQSLLVVEVWTPFSGGAAGQKGRVFIGEQFGHLWLE